MNKVIALLSASFLFTAFAVAEEAHPGKELYEKHCDVCHGGTVSKAPPITLLQIMAASSIYRSLDNGIMSEQASMLSDEQRRDVAEYLTGQSLADGNWKDNTQK